MQAAFGWCEDAVYRFAGRLATTFWMLIDSAVSHTLNSSVCNQTTRRFRRPAQFNASHRTEGTHVKVLHVGQVALQIPVASKQTGHPVMSTRLQPSSEEAGRKGKQQ